MDRTPAGGRVQIADCDVGPQSISICRCGLHQRHGNAIDRSLGAMVLREARQMTRLLALARKHQGPGKIPRLTPTRNLQHRSRYWNLSARTGRDRLRLPTPLCSLPVETRYRRQCQPESHIPKLDIEGAGDARLHPVACWPRRASMRAPEISEGVLSPYRAGEGSQLRSFLWANESV